MTKSKLSPDVLEARAEVARNAVRTRRVLREYARKLHDIADRLRTRRLQIAATGFIPIAVEEAQALMQRRRVIASAVELFCRAASGMVDQGAMDWQSKAELLLRLREVENALDETRFEAAALRQLSPKQFSEKLLEDVSLPELKTVRYAVG